MLLDTRRPSRPHAKSTWSGLQCQSPAVRVHYVRAPLFLAVKIDPKPSGRSWGPDGRRGRTSLRRGNPMPPLARAGRGLLVQRQGAHASRMIRIAAPLLGRPSVAPEIGRAAGPQAVEDGRFDVDEALDRPDDGRATEAHPRAPSSRWRGRRRARQRCGSRRMTLTAPAQRSQSQPVHGPLPVRRSSDWSSAWRAR